MKELAEVMLQSAREQGHDPLEQLAMYECLVINQQLEKLLPGIRVSQGVMAGMYFGIMLAGVAPTQAGRLMELELESHPNFTKSLTIYAQQLKQVMEIIDE